MQDIIKVPVKTFPDGEKWLLLDSILGRRVTLRAHEITLKENVAHIQSYKDCIRCYCCQEACPHKAITLSKPLVERIVRFFRGFKKKS